MKKKSKRIISIFGTIALMLLVIIPFIRINTVHATPEKVWLEFDSANVSGNMLLLVDKVIHGPKES